MTQSVVLAFVRFKSFHMAVLLFSFGDLFIPKKSLLNRKGLKPNRKSKGQSGTAFCILILKSPYIVHNSHFPKGSEEVD